ncbi:MAG TPA: hypothetical protein VGT44_06265 [Ktedonobacteraceae bacterium]|nr:hypothetical protein [Ktedonobacteraceae bacterium]
MTAQVETRRYVVGEYPHIAIKNDFGTIRAFRGAHQNEVVVQITRRNRIFGHAPESVHASYKQEKGGNELVISIQRDEFSLATTTTEVDVDIALPGRADLDLVTKAGTITVTDAHGQLASASSAGTITIRHSLLTGDSHISTEAGTIHFEGALEPRGKYQFNTVVGAIHVVLFNTPAFHVDATTTLGSITTNLPGVVVARPSVLGSEAHGDVGMAPHALLALKSTIGAIELQAWALAATEGSEVSAGQFALG